MDPTAVSDCVGFLNCLNGECEERLTALTYYVSKDLAQ